MDDHQAVLQDVNRFGSRCKPIFSDIAALQEEFRAHVEAIFYLHQGLANVHGALVERMNAIAWSPPVGDDASPFAREQRRRVQFSNSLGARLRSGAGLVRKLPTVGGRAEIPDGELNREVGEWPLAHAGQVYALALRQAIDDLYANVLAKYITTIVLTEMPTLWDHTQTFERLPFDLDLSDDERDAAEGWRRLRGEMWTAWREALDKAGFELIIPAPGDPLDYELHEIFAVSHPDEAQGAVIEDVVQSVAAPGLRWRPKDLLFAPAKVNVGASPAAAPEDQDAPVESQTPDEPGQFGESSTLDQARIEAKPGDDAEQPSLAGESSAEPSSLAENAELGGDPQIAAQTIDAELVGGDTPSILAASEGAAPGAPALIGAAPSDEAAGPAAAEASGELPGEATSGEEASAESEVGDGHA